MGSPRSRSSIEFVTTCRVCAAVRLWRRPLRRSRRVRQLGRLWRPSGRSLRRRRGRQAKSRRRHRGRDFKTSRKERTARRRRRARSRARTRLVKPKVLNQRRIMSRSVSWFCARVPDRWERGVGGGNWRRCHNTTKKKYQSLALDSLFDCICLHYFVIK